MPRRLRRARNTGHDGPPLERWAGLALVLTVVGVLIAAIALGRDVVDFTLPIAADESPAPSSSSTLCAEDPAVALEAATQAGPAVTIELTFHCAPPPGEEYYLVTELLEVDMPKNPHSVFFLTKEYGRPQPGTVKRFTLDLARSDVGSKRRVAVLQMTPSAATHALKSNLVVDNGVLERPTADPASNEVMIKRAW